MRWPCKICGLGTVPHNSVQMPFSCQFAVLYPARNKLNWQLGPNVFFEVCLRPGSVAESAHVHLSCAKTDLCLSKIPFKGVLLPSNMTNSALHLFPIQKRTASSLCTPHESPMLYLQKVGQLEQGEVIMPAFHALDADTAYLPWFAVFRQ